LQPIRTAGEIHAHIKILSMSHPYLYQKLSQKATELHLLGMSFNSIGKILSVDPKTIAKAIKKNRDSPKRTK